MVWYHTYHFLLSVSLLPYTSIKRPTFEMVSAAQTIMPNSDKAIDEHLRKVGLTFHLLKDVPRIISKNIEKILVEAFTPIGINNWNSIFWIVHPGGPMILDQVEEKLRLKEEKPGYHTGHHESLFQVLPGFPFEVATRSLHQINHRNRPLLPCDDVL